MRVFKHVEHEKVIFSSSRNTDDDLCKKLFIKQTRSFFNGTAQVTYAVE
jgi:hypothetical protein